MRIAILGTKGVPNNHGGFEQFAEYLSEYLANRGHDVSVYSPHNHPYQHKKWKGVNIIHQYDPEGILGSAGQFIYDLNCILHIRKSKFDVVLQLGYTSSSIWGKLLPRKSIIVTNMDGLEWKRSKYNKLTQVFLKFAEALAINTSDYLISDSIGIQNHLKEKYDKRSEYIAYGANVFLNPEERVIKEYQIFPYNYNLLIARLEPENNIETILDGVELNKNGMPFLVIGKHNTKYGKYLLDKFKSNSEILFLGSIYNQNHLNNLRYYSNLYFHGHSVGGTNPSLLEAMASNALIVANDNIFNKSILNNDAFYFSNSVEVSQLLKKRKPQYTSLVKNNKSKIVNQYTLSAINGQYEKFLKECLKK
jgi:glycosyltransferase involved in cell wall biosynthesis